MSDLFELMMAGQQKQELQRVLACNQKTQRWGLSLTEREAGDLMLSRKNYLRENQRVEFGEGILPKIIEWFCDSQFIDQDNYADILGQLQEIFYYYKNETADEMTDGELLDFMRDQFENVCFGDMEQLRGTCLERLARAVRSGYMAERYQGRPDEYALRPDKNEYDQFSEETSWEFELYRTALEDLE